MKNFISFCFNKSFWTIIVLLLSIWSCYSFYWTGYSLGKTHAYNNNKEQIQNQKKEILKLRSELYDLKHSNIASEGIIARTDQLVINYPL